MCREGTAPRYIYLFEKARDKKVRLILCACEYITALPCSTALWRSTQTPCLPSTAADLQTGVGAGLIIRLVINVLSIIYELFFKHRVSQGGRVGDGNY